MPPIVWNKNRGRNGWDPPLEVGQDQSVESVNVTLYNSGLGTKRGGSQRINFGTTGTNALYEHIPGQDHSAAELFAVDNAAVKNVYRSTTGVPDVPGFNPMTLADAIVSEAYNVSFATLNGKLYIAYDSAVNRLHVFDPNNATTFVVRRAGMGTPAAPTVATLGGAGLTFTGTYKVAFTEQQSGVTMRRSELSDAAALSITDDLGIRVTKPAGLSEYETHWEIYRLNTDGIYYLLTTLAVGTTTYDDTSATPPSDTAEPSAGANTPWPSVKYLATDGNRLLGFGVWETTAGDSVTPHNGRVYFSPVLDSSELHDDERLSNTTEVQGFIDVARNSGAVDRGITPKPVNNVFYVFQSLGVYGLIPTESDVTPYRRVSLTSSVGAVNNQSIIVADQKDGAGAVYFLDPVKGPYTIGGRFGLKWCGKDVKDIWDTVNRDTALIPAWGLWYPDRNIVMFAIATGTNTTPDTMLILDVTELYVDEDGDLRGGWTVWTGDFAESRCGVMFSQTFASPRSAVRVPHVGTDDSAFDALLRYDEDLQSDDDVAFQAYVTSGALAQDTLDVELRRSYLAASAEDGVTIQQSLVRNFGDESNRTSVQVLTPEGDETTVLRKFDDAALQDAWAVQVTLGDDSAVASSWTLYQWRAELETGGPR